MHQENRAQASIELLLALGIIILIATVAALIAKSVFTQLSPGVSGTTNNIITNIS